MATCQDRTRKIGRVTLQLGSTNEAVSEIKRAICARSAKVFAFCNMHTFNHARRSRRFAEALAQATVFNDGVGIDVASKILFGSSFPENLNGSDLTPAVLRALDRPTSLFLLGSKPGVCEKAGRALEAEFEMVSIAGCHHGYFSDAESGRLAELIRRSGADLVLVGMGHPRQEIWSAENAAGIGVAIMCVGAYLDFASGQIRRAPRIVRSARIEWLYRLAVEPRRLYQRYLVDAVPFLWAIAAERIGKNRVQ